MRKAARIYLDACAPNRLLDDPSIPRVRREAEAVETILSLQSLGAIQWVASSVLEAELDHYPHPDLRRRALDQLAKTQTIVMPDETSFDRADQLVSEGFGRFDALHLACAEQENLIAFLTTDDRSLRKAARGVGRLNIRTINPVDWVKEFRR